MYLKAQFPPLLRLWPWVWQPSVDRTKLPLRPKSPQSSVIDQNTPLSHQPSEHSSSSLSGVFRQIRFQVLTHISNGFFVSEYGIKNCTNIVLEILGCVSSWEKLVSHRIEAVGWWTENFVRNSKQMISSVVAGAAIIKRICDLVETPASAASVVCSQVWISTSWVLETKSDVTGVMYRKHSRHTLGYIGSQSISLLPVQCLLSSR